jgi:SPP1 family predicted phage head-tail adaptor
MQPWPKIDPGEMVHQVTILQQTQGVDISGAVTVWTPFVTTWAAIDPVRGTDVLKSGQDTTNLYLTVKVRWQTGIQANMRLLRSDGVTTYIIQAIENVGERNVILVLFCLALGLNQ